MPRVAADAELLVVTFLRGRPEVAELAGDRVWTDPPPEASPPFVRLFRVGGPPARAGWLDRPRLQVEAYGPRKFVARELAARVERALLLLPGSVVGEAVVTDCEIVAGLRWAPDSDTGEARYIVECSIAVHPTP